MLICQRMLEKTGRRGKKVLRSEMEAESRAMVVVEVKEETNYDQIFGPHFVGPHLIHHMCVNPSFPEL